MKRILIALGLVLCMGVSAPLATAADSFELGLNLNENLSIWLENSGVFFDEIPGFGSASQFDVALIFDQSLIRSGLPGVNYSSFTNGFTGFQNVLIDQFLALYTAERSGLVTADVTYYMLSGKVLTDYEWDGKTLNVVPGSLFVNVTLYEDGNMIHNHDLIFTPAGTFMTPIPAAALLLGSGLAGIAVLRRKIA